jgi:hypothetical protein
LPLHRLSHFPQFRRGRALIELWVLSLAPVELWPLHELEASVPDRSLLACIAAEQSRLGNLVGL